MASPDTKPVETPPLQPRRRGQQRDPHDPDEVPHGVVGTLALTIVGLALLMGVVVMAGSNGVTIAAMLIVPIAIIWLIRRANRARHEA